MKEPNHFEVFRSLLDNLINCHSVETLQTVRYLRRIIKDALALRVEGFPGLLSDSNCISVTLIVNNPSGIYRIPFKVFGMSELMSFMQQVKEAMLDFRFDVVRTDTSGLTFDQLLHLSPWHSVHPLDLTYSTEGVCLGGHIVSTTHPTRRMIRVRSIPQQKSE